MSCVKKTPGSHHQVFSIRWEPEGRSHQPFQWNLFQPISPVLKNSERVIFWYFQVYWHLLGQSYLPSRHLPIINRLPTTSAGDTSSRFMLLAHRNWKSKNRIESKFRSNKERNHHRHITRKTSLSLPEQNLLFQGNKTADEKCWLLHHRLPSLEDVVVRFVPRCYST